MKYDKLWQLIIKAFKENLSYRVGAAFGIIVCSIFKV